MLSLLVVVFLIQLVCHLVLTIGSKPINDLVSRRTILFPLLTGRTGTDAKPSRSYGKSTAVLL